MLVGMWRGGPLESLSLYLQSHHIYFNFFSFANLLSVVFTFLVGLFLLTLPNRSKSTNHLGLVFMWMAPFGVAYVFAHSYYGPAAAFHRWVTVGLILFPLIHMAQWCFKYPENTYPIFSRVFLVVQYVLAIAAFGYFAHLSLLPETGYKFNFAGQHWDFDLDSFSADFGKIIILYMVMILIVGAWKVTVTKGPERWTVFWITFTMLLATLPPAVFNVLSREGRISRGTFATVFVLFTVVGYFVMVVFYINRTKDRTSFMAKIVGISLVTFLVMMQMISLVTLREREAEYDQLHVIHTQRALEGGERHGDTQYIVRYSVQNGTIERLYEREHYNVAFEAHKGELANTAVYEDIRAMDEIGFRENLEAYLAALDRPYFRGYENAIQAILAESDLQDFDLKDLVLEKLPELDTEARVRYIKLEEMSNADFRTELDEYLRKTKDDARFAPFWSAIVEHVQRDEVTQGAQLKQDVLRFVLSFKPQYERHFRKLANEVEVASVDDNPARHFTAFTQYNRDEQAVYEIGYSYENYRQQIHSSAFQQKLILLVVLAVLLVVFPLFFRGSLVSPLNLLLRGVRKVNDGDLSVAVPVKVQDEIGFLAGSFNSMVVSIREAQVKLQDYANNLEEKVKERTAELNKTLERVNALKTQQDGDYFLTSLLQKPLNYNANKSKYCNVDFYLEQKKKFEFRNRHADLGGDLCVAGNLRLGTEDDYRRYVVACNGDAMGKSMQGAGGSLVMGVVMNSIMARSAKNNRILNSTPEQWLTEVYEELHGVFLAFNGSMVISAVLAVIDEESGDMWYFNAEHPFTVLYRNGKASFIEEELQLRKLGLESEIPFKVHYFKLEPGDVIFMGSDGRDDLDTTPDAPVRTINEDEYLFLRRVEEADGQIDRLSEGLKSFGVITDDLSLLRVGFQEKAAPRSETSEPTREERIVIDIDVHDEGLPAGQKAENFDELFEKGRELARLGRHDEALDYLREAYSLNKDVPALNKIMGVLSFKGRDYEHAVEVLQRYLEQDSSLVDFWLYLSIAQKRTGHLDKALEAGNRVLEMAPDRVLNLIHLADLHQKMGNHEEARDFLNRALELDPENRQARALQASLN
ncbi:MAG: SpoIIE family protein phosphatase [Spirochaetales bacterium]|nr:SpoIIE family protein phosphatase [Leptospiraceae bacterium]MCP5479798.1 SpoIIE family protein phosphatase [Spirochaetales bacterium]MCP5486949.1 SpoIIE family protein phosphatase [Spirochaetales bacterium]